LVIQAGVALQLGLETAGSAKVRYADGRTAERSIVKDIHLSYGGRESVFNAIVEPARESILIGAIVLEDLDFLVDCVGQQLVPRDPKQIVSFAEGASSANTSTPDFRECRVSACPSREQTTHGCVAGAAARIALASSGTVMTVEPTSLNSVVVVRSTSRSLPLKLTVPVT